MSTDAMRSEVATGPAAGGALTARGMLTQTLAMFVDAYRELNAKKLFWITMILSGLVVAAFGAVGFNETGFSIFWKSFDHTFFNTTLLPKEQLYKNLFLTLGVQTWLGWLAIILALVSTAPMFPDFLSGGAVDLYLARPLGRTRLFLTKYLVGLLFVAIQVAVFCVASFLVIGLRGGAWVPGLFLAVPVVVLMFSYLWSICAFIGTVTRSTIAALLLTMLAWFAIFGVDATEGTLLTFSVGSKVTQELLDEDIARFQTDIATLNAKPATTQPKSIEAMRVRTLEASLQAARADRAKTSDPFATWHKVAYIAKWPLPKTAETTKLLERWLDRQFRGSRERAESDPDENTNRSFFKSQRTQRLTELKVEQILRERSAVWVIGTSLMFEAAVLALTTWFFSRRDY